jgi:hypothetical protein
VHEVAPAAFAIVTAGRCDPIGAGIDDAYQPGARTAFVWEDLDPVARRGQWDKHNPAAVPGEPESPGDNPFDLNLRRVLVSGSSF